MTSQSAAMNFAAAADEVLTLCGQLQTAELRLSAAESSLLVLQGHGAVVGAPAVDLDTSPEEQEMDTATQADRTQVSIDIDRVLQEVFEPFGFSVGSKLTANVVEVGGSFIPKDSRACFLKDSSQPVFSARALFQTPVVIAFHVRGDLEAIEAGICRSAGVLPIRLRDVGLATGPKLRAEVDTLLAVGSLVGPGASLDTEKGLSFVELAQATDPAKVDQYASTQQDRKFEVAVAKIMSPLVDWILPLGGSLSGKPVPDGFMLRSAPLREACSYDCKSKKGDHYGLEPKDADQQGRYLKILQRLQEQGWKTHGVVLFTPAVPQAEFDEKTQKEFWRQFDSERVGGLLVVQARILRRWHELTSDEPPGAMHLHFNPSLFWKALFERDLPALSDNLKGGLLGDRATRLRLLTEDVAEVAWVAGFDWRNNAVSVLAEAAQETDPDSKIEAKIMRPLFVQKFHAALRGKKASLQEIATTTGFGPRAVKYLLASKRFFPGSPAEAGVEGVRNLDTLREELGLPKAT